MVIASLMATASWKGTQELVTRSYRWSGSAKIEESQSCGVGWLLSVANFLMHPPAVLLCVSIVQAPFALP